MDEDTDQTVPPPYPGGSTSIPLPSLPGMGGLVSVDFIPGCIKEGGMFSLAEYEPFSAVLRRANEWLGSCPTLQLKSCETVEFLAAHSGALFNYVESDYLTGSHSHSVRALRLWLQPRTDGSSVTQQIGYFNIIPAANLFNINTGLLATVRQVTAERLDTLIEQTNTMLVREPVPGRIVTIETVVLQVKPDGGIDSDSTSWFGVGNARDTFVCMLRVYYEAGPPQYETIGVADFVPAVLMEGVGLLGPPLLEPYPQVLAKTHHWLMNQSDIRVTNIQTMLHKQKLTAHLDTLRMAYTEDMLSYYVRYLRVAFVKVNPHAVPGSGILRPVNLNSKLFAPALLQPPKCCVNMVGVFESQLFANEWHTGCERLAPGSSR
ncbi:uncharacterized protein LOC129594034 isoform X2 [Paramacrobiotus metropolitanus]|uniref:uncharacterized protein LOC129594034 isoform X2 n=1 Tax=Paramacrobiotus metropolitanus TaxID=2943436 RepID=UPI002445764F|nr:uncharacterized protein LOC129594034 isoform X2 [Paramacrobiotus metropolitanus]